MFDLVGEIRNLITVMIQIEKPPSAEDMIAEIIRHTFHQRGE